MEVYEANGSWIRWSLSQWHIEESIIGIKENSAQRFITVSVHLASLSQVHLAGQLIPLLNWLILKTCRGS